ncbi:site-specific integrase [Pseudomonadaceae bacterium Sa2CUA2]|uniref:Site-specific integrase n=1 Tax=Serpens gallinarum TaxID=2763075 RepID=A0ABR8TM17_9PSED|nr:site-specific integrase [Serpens gallinarum]
MGKGESRFTLSKIRNYLFHQLVIDTHDIAAAGMLSGVRVPSAQTPQYYLQPSANHLRRLYVASLERVLQLVYACAGLAYEPAKVEEIDQEGSVGATHCLLPETISVNVKALASILRKKPSSGLVDQIAWHNAYTLWVVQMFMLSTGCRAIRNPLRYVDEFDPLLGIGAIADKDSGDRHMSRLVCLPAMLHRQLVQYFAHCAAITKDFISSASLEEDDRWSRGFFLSFSESGTRRVEIRPATIYQHMEQVAGYHPHRINAYRKFLRTELFERGCPAEALGAFMGHWLRGEEPQDNYASFCPVAYAEVIGEWITHLLESLGWYAQGSRWAGK